MKNANEPTLPQIVVPNTKVENKDKQPEYPFPDSSIEYYDIEREFEAVHGYRRY